MNALDHMWGYVWRQAAPEERRLAHTSPERLLLLTTQLALRSNVTYLVRSTALSDLAVYTRQGFESDARE